ERKRASSSACGTTARASPTACATACSSRSSRRKRPARARGSASRCAAGWSKRPAARSSSIPDSRAAPASWSSCRTRASTTPKRRSVSRYGDVLAVVARRVLRAVVAEAGRVVVLRAAALVELRRAVVVEVAGRQEDVADVALLADAIQERVELGLAVVDAVV